MAASWALSLGTTELTGLLGQVLEAHDVERCALTHQLQENTGQALATLAVQLRLLERHCTDAEQARRIGESRAVVAQALRDLESLLLTLYPPALEGQGLGPALEVFVQSTCNCAGSRRTRSRSLPERLPSNVEVGLFRIARTRCKRYAGGRWSGGCVSCSGGRMPW
jgi:signal transduction histidine kinase